MYTQKDLLDACQHILGEDVVAHLHKSRFSIPTIHEAAIYDAFMYEINNEFTDILREAATDLTLYIYMRQKELDQLQPHEEYL